MYKYIYIYIYIYQYQSDLGHCLNVKFSLWMFGLVHNFHESKQFSFGLGISVDVKVFIVYASWKKINCQ